MKFLELPALQLLQALQLLRALQLSNPCNLALHSAQVCSDRKLVCEGQNEL